EVVNFSEVHMHGGNWSFVEGIRIKEMDLANGKLAVGEGESIRIDELVVRDGAVLGGNGTIEGNVNNPNATTAPGASIGILTIAGTYTHGQDATLEVETRADGQADKLVVTGTATLQGGTVKVRPEDDLSGY